MELVPLLLAAMRVPLTSAIADKLGVHDPKLMPSHGILIARQTQSTRQMQMLLQGRPLPFAREADVVSGRHETRLQLPCTEGLRVMHRRLGHRHDHVAEV